MLIIALVAWLVLPAFWQAVRPDLRATLRPVAETIMWADDEAVISGHALRLWLWADRWRLDARAQGRWRKGVREGRWPEGCMFASRDPERALPAWREMEAPPKAAVDFPPFGRTRAVRLVFRCGDQEAIVDAPAGGARAEVRAR